MNKKLVLVVDDNPENLKVLGNILKEHDLSPAFAQNGSKALTSVNKKIPDLILLDIMMPDMDGFEVCKRLKQDEKTKEIPIIFLTAKVETDDVVKGLEFGAIDYVTKPFNSRELMVRVNTHLELKTAKEELQQAIATKDKFFSIIAHDLANLFNASISSSELLVNNTVPLDEKEKIEFLELIHENLEKGYILLQNLLEWARSQTGRLQITPTDLDLQFMVERNMALLDNNAKAKHIQLISDINAKWAVGDQHTIDTVIRNLLSNAIKFTPQNGKIEISTQQKARQIELSIQDNGVGITPENLDKLFRIDVSCTTRGTAKEKGTGLGLILCKEFVEKNDGTIGVETEAGKGSRFYFRLPLSPTK
jgi:two-component system, sensor histidine kinase and response regulator